uniref:Uncharacterized protein n=1 Tax=Trifolium subterraneum TaxID=3900 RepID=A0A2Z6LUT3_TRISU|nr:hypothetical protein TSUD_334010 [Trifolium subterraneum]
MATSFHDTLSPQFSPSSDKRFWSTLRCRIDSLLDNRQPKVSPPHHPSTSTEQTCLNERGNRLKEDSLLLIRGFDSVSHTLSLLSNNLDNALQGARELGNAPTLTDIFKSTIVESEKKEEEEDSGESKQGVKRKIDESYEDNVIESQSENGGKMHDKHIKKARNLAVSMASKTASLARELKSLKSDLCFMQERCGLLEEENRRLRDGFAKGVRLQLEALLGEKARLANENANLMRENQCLHQLVEYHQHTSEDLSESYENVIQGMCLDFSSPPRTISEEETRDDDGDDDDTNREEL